MAGGAKLFCKVRQAYYLNHKILFVLHESFLINNSPNLDSLRHDVVCLGNSITFHPPLSSVNWYSSQGMAALDPSKDYCHLLERKLKNNNSQSTVTPVNISAWERNYSINLDSLLRDYCEGKDIIVIRIGENVQDKKHFSDALSNLILYCKRYTDNILLTGRFWPDADVEKAIVENSLKYELKYVPQDWNFELYGDNCLPKEGDTLFNEQGIPYPIRGEFILTHPNDNGMRMIADAIYNAL